MIPSSKPKSPLHFLITSPFSYPASSLKWVSTEILKIPQIFQQQENPFLHLNSLLNPKTGQRHFNYELVLVSALKFCSDHLFLSQGKQIHCLVSKSGLGSNNFIQNSLINMYGKCGLLVDAKSIFDVCPRSDPVSYNVMISGYVKSGQLDYACELFDEMPVKGCVSYTTMIMGFSQNECWNQAVELFKQMRNVGVVPNEVTIATLVSAYSHFGGIWACRMLHGLVIKMLFEEFVLVSTNLLRMYCVCSSLVEARALFDEMPEKNIVSWNVMLNGYSKAGFVDSARVVFERIPNKDLVTWGTIIDGYVRVERINEALMMYRSMISAGWEPNDVMMVDLISGCGRTMAMTEGQQLLSAVVKMGFDCYDFIQSTIIHLYAACGRINEACLQFRIGSKENVASWNALIAGYVRNRMIDRAMELFNEMPERDVFSWSTMISGYTQNEQPNLALELFHKMVASGIKPNEVTMVSVLSAIATSGTLKEGRWAHEYVHNNSITVSDNLSAAIIDMYAKCGSINNALEVFYEIREKASTVSPWNAIICGLAVHGHANLSLKIFSDLERRHIKLNAITFIGVLTACCHVGLVESGKRHFMSMKSEHSIDPDIKHYGCMVDLLGRAGRLEEAEEMIRSMPMKADVVIWGTLLAACRTHGNVDVGERAAENLARLEPSHGASRVLLSNMYADAGKWEDAFLVRRAMQSHRMQRLPGYSGVALY
ncbi:pentatricopeptide repeat-containing protein At5g19020, mitochondrial [Ricinus communis]|uniref:Pentatricopeptide repeat-containing protein, putative n=1 Tax=Ricinus communis TaxID=3988 RepID=B9RSR9_RICCO|nr:pentatricopeptide repeat-containing protein At5g19020, mitochondrial [Ricinus communis]EEF45402.1 pentatricopeptide repeat-containing protein, putative [Ricinus communis]|eukprot:XP_002516788.1 pentatricopeptide repeat-containing protein At5g19020, mitochondrial [Ricinus communis]